MKQGLEAWLPENGPKTKEEWFRQEVAWAKTYITKGYSIPTGYFSPGVIELAKEEVALSKPSSE